VGICTIKKPNLGGFKMKICITAAGNDLNAATDGSFGRAPWFILVDTETDAVQAMENSSVNAQQGAGIAAAQSMSDNGVEAVLTGRLGPKAQTALAAAGVTMYEGLQQSTVGQALQQFRQGEYRETTAQTAPPQGGMGRGMGGGGGRCGKGNGRGSGQGRGQGRRN
jgi:predicted Fe-Mo cluster-binding NifX family protein